jgi:hypothetical protein
VASCAILHCAAGRLDRLESLSPKRRWERRAGAENGLEPAPQPQVDPVEHAVGPVDPELENAVGPQLALSSVYCGVAVWTLRLHRHGRPLARLAMHARAVVPAKHRQKFRHAPLPLLVGDAYVGVAVAEHDGAKCDIQSHVTAMGGGSAQPLGQLALELGQCPGAIGLCTRAEAPRVLLVGGVRVEVRHLMRSDA